MPKKRNGPGGAFAGPPTRIRNHPSSPDPLGRTAADRHLQEEISQALENLADSLPALTDLRLARVLGTILEPSWSEHASFQDNVLFPIIARHSHRDGAGELEAVLERLVAEHAELADRHAELVEQLEELAGGKLANFDMLGYLLRSVFDFRRRHVRREAEIERLVPRLLTPADRATLSTWTAGRPAPPFPLNLIL